MPTNCQEVTTTTTAKTGDLLTLPRGNKIEDYELRKGLDGMPDERGT